MLSLKINGLSWLRCTQLVSQSFHLSAYGALLSSQPHGLKCTSKNVLCCFCLLHRLWFKFSCSKKRRFCSFVQLPQLFQLKETGYSLNDRVIGSEFRRPRNDQWIILGRVELWSKIHSIVSLLSPLWLPTHPSLIHDQLIWMVGRLTAVGSLKCCDPQKSPNTAFPVLSTKQWLHSFSPVSSSPRLGMADRWLF